MTDLVTMEDTRTLETRVSDLERKVDALVEVQSNLLTTLQGYGEQLKPVLDKLENSPIFKMLGG